MTKEEFEGLLVATAATLTGEIQQDEELHDSTAFENRARVVLRELAAANGIEVGPAVPQVFPDIVLDEFGADVKVCQGDSWRSIANSIFEGSRDPNVKHVYILYGKMGGSPEVRWGRYEDCVMHVRTSHVPRFEIEIGAKESLFTKFGVSYQQFCSLDVPGKMQLVRQYARSRMKPGDHTWWLEDRPQNAQEHSLPLEVRLYMSLDQEEKRKLRAQAALLCPQVVGPSTAKKKYDDVAMYLITYHGVLCSQARDLFSAGSVALRGDGRRGGLYIRRALQDLEAEMRQAAQDMESALFVEYWGVSVPPAKRIKQWLARADKFAKDWVPSRHLFLPKGRRRPSRS